jgi:hypothetical protein
VAGLKLLGKRYGVLTDEQERIFLTMAGDNPASRTQARQRLGNVAMHRAITNRAALTADQPYRAKSSPVTCPVAETVWRNRLYYGDNLEIMREQSPLPYSNTYPVIPWGRLVRLTDT